MSLYNKVFALMFCWADDTRDNRQFKDQRLRLAQELENWNFEVELHDLIPGPTAYKELTYVLLEVLKSRDLTGSLIIIYYGGHGGQNEDKDAVWFCFNPDPEAENDENHSINWSNLQGLLFYDYGVHFLFLLDCCHAGAVFQETRSANVVEALCATGFQGRTPSTKDSFTENIMSYMEELRRRRASILLDQFWNDLANRMRLRGGDSTCPIRIVYSPKGKGIVQLAPLPKRYDPPQISPTLSQTVEAEPSGEELVAHASQRPLSLGQPLLALPIRTAAEDEPLGTLSYPQNRPPTTRDFRHYLNYYEATSRPASRRREYDSDDEDTQTLPDLTADVGSQVLISAKLSTYRYDVIEENEIRLLRVQPAHNESSELICEILIRPFPMANQTHRKYRAVSWIWGEAYAGSMQDLRIVGETVSKIHVPTYITNMLKKIRRSGQNVDLWIDAICIWQQSEEEKARTLWRYPEIFRHASAVYLWSGPEDEKTMETLNFIELLNTTRSDDIFNDPSLGSKWRLLTALMTKQCFNRRWIFQELAFAQRICILIGKHRLDWSRFCEAVSVADNLFEKVGRRSHQARLQDLRNLDAFDLIQANRNFFRSSVDSSATFQKLANLETLVSCLPRLQCSDPRDTVYALMWPAADQAKVKDTLFAELPYEKAVLEVFQEFVQYCVQASKSVDIMCRHWTPSRKVRPNWARGNRLVGTEICVLPSWMGSIEELPSGPSDDVLGRITRVSLVGTPTRHYYNTSRGVKGLAIFRDIETVKSGLWTKSMLLCGFELGRIDQLERSKIEQSFGHISEDAKNIAGFVQGDRTVPDHLWRTLVADRGPNGDHPPLWYHDACLYWLNKSHTSASNLLLHREDHSDMTREFLARVVNTTFTRRFTSLRDSDGAEFFGLVPDRSQEGDSVVIVQGCSVPVVLRPSRKCEMSWELVGECFVYGVMDGEAMMDQRYRLRLSEYNLV